jgi:hypothetical protein
MNSIELGPEVLQRRLSVEHQRDTTQPADHRDWDRATASAPPSSRTPRRRHDDIGRASR